MSNEDLQQLKALAEKIKSRDYSIDECNKFIDISGPDVILALIERIESLAANAERYQWLLNNYALGDGYHDIDAALNDGEADKYLSPAIDVAMEREKAK